MTGRHDWESFVIVVCVVAIMLLAKASGWSVVNVAIVMAAVGVVVGVVARNWFVAIGLAGLIGAAVVFGSLGMLAVGVTLLSFDVWQWRRSKRKHG